MKSLFKHSVLDLLLVLQTICCVIFTLAIALLDLDFLWILLLTPVQVALMVNIHQTSLHHHCHWSTFRSKNLNNLYELFLACASGLQPQSYRWVHSVHHKWVNDRPVDGKTKDMISVFAHSVTDKPENLWLFCIREAFKDWSTCWRLVFYQIWKQPKPNIPVNVKQYRMQAFAVVLFPIVIIATDFTYGLWFMLVVCTLSHFLDYVWHYGEHFGSYHFRGDTTRDAVGIYNKLYNSLCFNSGYHQEHHHRPGCHWSLLATVTPELPESRIIKKGMHIFNVPWWSDLKNLGSIRLNK